ncbi:MAG: hypothetical protein H6642_16325 [Caldilineaceae bacterium]|nr:hypothetical protein [Caldilineaceae bacterium]MCB9139910.1 hypothetical protein [Caldilineaceae bacterium]
MWNQYSMDVVKQMREEEIARIQQERLADAILRQEHPEETLLYRVGNLLEGIGHRMKVQVVAPQRRSYGRGSAG